MKFKKGDKVRIKGYIKIYNLTEKVLVCKEDSFQIGQGSFGTYKEKEVVFLENYSGWFYCDFLEKIK